MEATNRRAFLRQAGFGAAAVGAVVAAPRLGLDRSAGSTGANLGAVAEDLNPAKLEGPLVAYLKDASNGVFSLLVGEREVLFTDKALAARLTRAAV